MPCSLPSILGLKRWFEERFSDLCEQHDESYVLRVWQVKWVSDFRLCMSIAARGYVTLSLLTFVYVATLGTIYWAWKKYK